MSDVLIRCENVGKIFCKDLRRSLWYGVKDIASDLRPRGRHSLPKCSDDVQLRNQEFWANRDVSFEVRRGECLGLIGRNGAGKTTLLKMLNGLIKPDTGRIEMRGKIAAMIALGAGFNTVLSGRENIYINGSILGLSKQKISDRFDEIVDFAELEDFIDTSVRNYSSGMQVRLGFACAAILVKPDVLILDEVLAVGDGEFRAKCYKMIQESMVDSAVILVSHTMTHISQFCSHAILMDKGVVSHPVEEPNAAIQRYNSLLYLSPQATGTSFSILEFPVLRVTTSVGAESIQSGEEVCLDINVECAKPISRCFLRVELATVDDRTVVEWNSLRDDNFTSLPAGSCQIRCGLGPLRLRAGIYFLHLSLIGSGTGPMYFRAKEAERIVVTGSALGLGEVQLPLEFSVCHQPRLSSGDTQS